MKFLSKLLTIVIFFDILINSAVGYKILGIFPLTIKSHDIFCHSVIKALLKQGHHVDVIVARELENSPKNYKVLYNTIKITPNITYDITIDKVLNIYKRDPIKMISNEFGNFLCSILANGEIQEIIKKLKIDSNYDVLITEAFGMNCFMAIGHFLNIPVITLSAQTLYPWVENTIGNPSTAATHPNIISSLVEINSFWDRLQNIIEKHVLIYKFHYYTDKIQTELIRKYISADLPNVEELTKNSILTLINTHFSFNGIKPMTPALIEVGGLHILQDDTKFTPKLQKWMDESVNGVVYFSMGTIILVDSLQKEIILAFYSLIQKLKPIRFLIRAKNAKQLFPGSPTNLMILPWIPQIPVLRHKNTKAFISHCGLLSSMEAFYFGIPVIGIPVAADQFFNMDKLVKRNMGIKLNINNITEEILFDALMRILNNSTYREAAKKASIYFKDRPISAEESTTYWIEYVLRNGGILKSPAINLHWTQNELLDIYGFLLLLFLLILYIIVKILRIIFNFKNKNIIKKKKTN